MRPWNARVLTVMGVCALVVASAGIGDLLGVLDGARGATPVSETPAIPRTADDKPDLSGLWQTINTANYDIEDHSAAPGIPAGMGIIEGNEIPYQEWALARRKENFANRATIDTEAKCFQPGVPRVMYMGFPFQILQRSEIVTVLHEYAHTTRHIYTNGTPHPEGHIPFYLGDSRGRWEGETLVVDTTHFNDETWFDRAGNFHSEDLHVVERFTLMGPDHIDYEVTIEDPKVFTRPWTMRMVFYRHKERNFQLISYDCTAFHLEKLYPYPELAIK